MLTDPGSPPRRQTNRWPGVVARLAVTAGILWYLLTVVPLAAIRDAVAAANPLFVLAALSAQVLLRMSNAVRIRIIARAQGAPLSYRAILKTLFTTGFYALMLPGGVGGGAATLVKYVGHGVTPAAALASMIVNRLIETVTVIAMGLFWWGFDHRAIGSAAEPGLPEILLVTAPLLLIGFHLLLFGRARALRRFASFIRSPRLENGRLYRSFANVVARCAEASNLSRRAAFGVGVQSVLQDLLATVVAYSFAHAVGIELSFVTIAWMRGAVALLLLLPISFSGVGVRDSALVLMTKAYGVAAPVAVAWSFLQFCGLLFIALIGAAIEARSFWRR
jgi:glycosyltransferase 2 family protein